ncbi:GntR family transcriptional regulator [Paractinoplanes abujensis]|uniref:GntR family transcriptional regulator n=1 Tax=Paractinoplanes abujensis TaxID=882441 RepID=A0A7W7G049_9ACTN|nr:GntR family transcriptional regulator [Actinoplanes abujensis]MBB4692753.1 GntR family transcriptional regulator [Actinoplanes abujensis]GID22748.1 GntR family transcriptional regulator [Actinoplanes abujensis]
MRRTEVRERLREIVGTVTPGEPLPSERDLSVQLGTSRPTLRIAIEELTREGLLVRRHGRGTFRNLRKISQEVPSSADLPPAEGDWRSELLEYAVTTPDDTIRALRLRIVDGAPMALEEIRVPLAVAPGLSEADFTSESLYQRLREVHGVFPAEAVQTTEPTLTTPAQSRLLEVPPHSPALLFERTTRDAAGRVIEHARSVYRGDRYRITQHLRFGPESG